MKKYFRELLLILFGALIGLIIEVAFESPVRTFFYPDKRIVLSGIVKDKNTKEPISNIEVLLINIGKDTTTAKGKFSFDVNQTLYKEVTLQFESTNRKYDSLTKSLELADGNKEFIFWLTPSY